jgi:hypothetical protein
MNRWHLLALILLVALAQAGISLIGGQLINIELFTKASLVSLIVGAGVFSFDRWLWRIPVLHPWFVAAPDLSGEWSVSAKISYLRTATSGRYSGLMTIKQTFFSITADIDWGPDGTTRFLMKAPLATREEGFGSFSAIYEYAPSQEDRHGTQTHRAGFFFHARERKPQTVDLYYSTVGEQVGQLVLSRKA